MTNRHVIEGADKVKIVFKDGREFDGEVLGVDRESDIGVVKIDATGLTPAKLGDSSKTKAGEFAIAIGSPFELNYSVTVGHVSAKGRRVFSDQFMFDQDFIQTDASINPGNSGGPLVNIYGEVIGINTLIRGMNTGIGFAVPVNLAKRVADMLIKDGKVTRAWLGVSITTLREDTDCATWPWGLRTASLFGSLCRVARRKTPNCNWQTSSPPSTVRRSSPPRNSSGR